MAHTDLTLRERSALLVLMAESRVITNPDLKQRFGVELTKGSRKKLAQLGLIDVSEARSGKTKRKVLAYELTERGWGWAASEVATDRPGSGAGTGALYAVLNGLHRYLDREGLVLAEVFGDEVAEQAPAEPPAESGLEQRIRTAYSELSRTEGDWVRLATLRTQLPGIARQQVDDTLKRLFRERTLHLIPNENRKDLVAADRAAAIRLGGDDMHLVMVG
ncbi:MAG: hypothetical protein KTR31_13520 [Myxococcales bacterium]|nr:hypothetical protein [Myxococcales bacterium]